MRIYIILFFLLAVFLSSCGEQTPPGILGHKQMTALLIDMHIADGTLMQVSQDPDSLFKHSAGRYQYTFKQHQTDSTQFKKSFKYYTNKPDQLFDIYEEVYTAIKAKSDSATKVKIKTDSLERIRQAKLNEQISKRAVDSIRRVEKIKTDSLQKKARADSIAQTIKLNKRNALPRK